MQVRNLPAVRTLGRDAMLELWRLVRHFEPLAPGATASRADGTDLDALLLADIDRWYAACFATLPDSQLPQADFAAETEIELDSTGAGTVALPARCLRVVEVMLTGWARPATVTEAGSALAAEQSSRYTRGARVDPVAVVSPAACEMRLYTPPSGTRRLARLIGVAWPADGTYDVTPFMLPEAFE